ncbi:hypothetical protein F5Y13DRAFT_151193 [Hypoxylon sp. FL1857]|nr:hypothetical protein F5Y13DRAFT_151193 [Hypoxylon sp. FL1857]
MRGFCASRSPGVIGSLLAFVFASASAFAFSGSLESAFASSASVTTIVGIWGSREPVAGVSSSLLVDGLGLALLRLALERTLSSSSSL